MSHRTIPVVLGALGLVAVSTTAWGSTIYVNSDLLEPTRQGQCTLVGAMENANADAAVHSGCTAGDGADVIVLERAKEYVLDRYDNFDNGVNGLPAVVGELVINGNGSVISRSDGVEAFRIFYVPAGSKLVLNDLSIHNGRLDAPLRGGGIYNSGGEVFLNNCAVYGNRVEEKCGGILNQYGTMTLVDSRVKNNEAGIDGGGVCNWFGNLMMFGSEVDGNTSGADGGGIFNVGRADGLGNVFLSETDVTNNRAFGAGAGICQQPVGSASDLMTTLTVVRSTISGNVAESVGGGVDVTGSSHDLITSRVEVRDSTLSGNQGSFGAGIFAWYGTDLTVSGTSVLDNYAMNGSGGGVFVGDGSRLMLARSTLADNSAGGSGEFEGYGGALAVTDSVAEVRLCTLSGNEAQTRDGAAIWVSSGVGVDGQNTAVKIRGSTIFQNQAQRVGAGIKADRMFGEASVEVAVLNSILAQNSVFRLGDNAAILSTFGNCSWANGAVITSDGYNAVDEGTCRFSAAGDRVVDDVMLFDLADNGGQTPTHLPRSGSPVVDTGGSDGSVTCTDQRGYLRNADGDLDGVCLCDTGAVEARSQPMTVPHDGEPGGPEMPGLDD